MLAGLASVLQGALNILYEDASLLIPGASVSDGQGGTIPGAPTEYEARASVTAYKQEMYASGRIPLSHRQAFVISDVQPVRDSRIMFADSGEVWQVVASDRDPARAVWICQVHQDGSAPSDEPS